MIYESTKMQLKPVSTLRQSKINDIVICRDMAAGGANLYTVAVIKDHETARKFLKVCQDYPEWTEEITTFSVQGEFVVAFPYKTERNLFSFYMGDTYDLTTCEDICINVILTCIATRIPAPILYLILEQRKLNLSKDHSVYFDYDLDLSDFDAEKTERDCTVQCASILLELLAPKESQKAISYILLQKKIAKRSYRKFTELYKDIRIAAAPKNKQSLIRSVRFFFKRNKDIIFRVLFWICMILLVLVLVSLISQLIFGDIPFLRIFFNSFETIGTESLLQ
ncbi:MAG: hypothetical protein K5641_02670 [Lachnospiraceae bacterium]|nr:hypothetical protein [Lachnospiraceae bacterium]